MPTGSMSREFPTPVREGTGWRNADGGRLLLRLIIGLLILFHGTAKIATGPGQIMQMLQAHGLPGFLAWGVYLGEVVAPLLVIVGVWTRAAASVMAINMLVAIGLVHLGDVFKLSPQGGWALELQGLYLMGAVAIALLGAGRLSFAGVHGRYN